MAEPAQRRAPVVASRTLPRIVFVLGKGGVGRSTVAAALGLVHAARGERVAVLEWAVADPIGPWFGAPPVGPTPTQIAPGLAAANFSLDEALRAYFVDHLRVGLVYRRIIRTRAVGRLIAVAPGLAEMFFLGHMWWLTTLAEREAGIAFDRIIVDAPATGHGASLLDVPATIAGMNASGMLALETQRLTDMLADPARTGAIIVAQPEPLIVDETLELVPRVTARIGLAGLVVNASTAAVLPEDDPRDPRLRAIADELRRRAAIERDLRDRIACPSVAIPDLPGRAPIDVVHAAARVLEAAW